MFLRLLVWPYVTACRNAALHFLFNNHFENSESCPVFIAVAQHIGNNASWLSLVFLSESSPALLFDWPDGSCAPSASSLVEVFNVPLSC